MSAGRSDLYDPHMGRDDYSHGGERTKHIQEELDKVKDVIMDNMQKAANRGERLDHLQNKTDDLSQQSGQFKRNANQMRKKMWWKDMKMRMCIIVGIIILLIVIIVPSAYYGSRH